MSAIHSDDSDTYEPSQLLHEPSIDKERTYSRRARRSPIVQEAQKRIRSLYAAGGALDSQTTDSQFVDALVNTRSPRTYESEDVTSGWRSVGVQADGLIGYEERAQRLVSLELENAKDLIKKLESELGEARMERDRVKRELRDIRDALYDLLHVTDLRGSFATPPSARYERPKLMVATGDDAVWLAADEESQLIVSPPRSLKRARTYSNSD